MIRRRFRRRPGPLLYAPPRPAGPPLNVALIRAHRDGDGGCLDNTMLPGWCVDCGRATGGKS